MPWTSGVSLGEPGPAAAIDGHATHDQATHLQTRDRLFWIALARSWRNWRMALMLVQPDTVVRWHRDWLRRRWTRRSTPPADGRPPIDHQIRALVRDMASANPLWGAPRIHGELRAVGIVVSERTVSRLLESHPRPHSQTWRTVSHQSPRHSRLDRFLHRSDGHRPGTVRPPGAIASPPAHRALQHDRTSDSDVDSSASGRHIPGRHRANLFCIETGITSLATSSCGDWRAWASRKSSRPRRVLGKIRSSNA
jgi:Homeodomain-like domain